MAKGKALTESAVKGFISIGSTRVSSLYVKQVYSKMILDPGVNKLCNSDSRVVVGKMVTDWATAHQQPNLHRQL